MRSQAKRLFLSGILSFGMMGATEAFAQSLLNRATVPSHTIPAGWTELITQGWEDGALPPPQFGASPCSDRAHSGSFSGCATTGGDGKSTRWFGERLGVNREVYLSWWEFLESQGRMNDEMYLAHFIKRGLPGGPLGSITFQEVIVDWFQDSVGTINSTAGRLVLEPQGGYVSTSFYTGNQEMAWGAGWTQWEVHFKANTPGVANGFTHIYKNGVLNTAWDNKNINGTADMAGMDIQVGGTYTRLVWRHTNGSCGTFIGDGQTIPSNGHTETAWYRCTDFTACSCSPNTPVFKRYLDDIIVMIPSSAPDVPPGPPTPPLGLNVR